MKRSAGGEYSSVGMILLALFVTVFIIETISQCRAGGLFEEAGRMNQRVLNRSMRSGPGGISFELAVAAVVTGLLIWSAPL